MRVVTKHLLRWLPWLFPALAWAGGIWVDSETLQARPMAGPAWERLLRAAEQSTDFPDLSNQEDPTNVRVLAKALVFSRRGDANLREQVVAACETVMGSEVGATALSLGRELAAYVIAADLVGLPPDLDARFRAWLEELRGRRFAGRSLISTHEQRPNNWGTHAGASRVAVDVYLGDRQDLERAARVFRGWLGERDVYAGFRYRNRAWQADPARPVGINPRGALRLGHSIDGVLPDDQRRAGRFRWPPPKENYVYEALQGALVQAVILSRAGYDVWSWGDHALLRAFDWLYKVANFPARGDDTWQPALINFYYGTQFFAPRPSHPGKNMGWTDWTHGGDGPGDGVLCR